MARHGAQRVENAGLGDPASDDLLLDHRGSLCAPVSVIRRPSSRAKNDPEERGRDEW
jgi:hypothetical protein